MFERKINMLDQTAVAVGHVAQADILFNRRKTNQWH